MPRRLPSVAIFCLLSPLAACADEPSFVPPEELLGRWEQHGRSGSMLGEWTFLDDGTYVFVDYLADGAERPGTYAADGRELELGLSWGVETMTYFADGDVVLLRALLPDAGADGLVGTWRGGSRNDSTEGYDSHDNTLTVSEDGTATFAQRFSYGSTDRPGGESDWVVVGDWAVEDERLFVREEALYGLKSELRFFFVSGGAIGESRLSRPSAGD